MPDIMPQGVTGDQPPPQTTPTAPPAGTPDAAPQKNSGAIEQAKANVQIALTMLEQTLPMLGSDNDEGKAVLGAITQLSKRFGGKKSGDLAPAEIMQLISSMPDQYKQQIAAGMGGGKPQAPQGGMPQMG
jgi:hypothetical protein